MTLQSSADAEPRREPSGNDEAALRFEAREGRGLRIDRFLATRLQDVSRSRIQRWIELGAVCVDSIPVLSKYRLRGPELIEVSPLPSDAEQAFEPDEMPLSIVYEDADLMVIDKPVGLVVHPAPGHWRGTLMNGILSARPDSARLPRAGIIHRLDKDTSGLLMIARNEVAFERLTAALAARSIHRRYVAVVEGTTEAQFSIDAPIGRDPRDRLRMAVVPEGRGKPAQTQVIRLSAGVGVSVVACQLQTGRTHQIRVHLASLGHPLVGDSLYGGRARADCARQALHAWRLNLQHPRTGEHLALSSAVPNDLRMLLESLGLPVPAPDEAEPSVGKTGR